MNNKIGWYYLAHLGYNMWMEPLVDRHGIRATDASSFWSPYVNATDTLRFDEDYWQQLAVQLQQAGCTSILLDVGEGLIFDSHPELAIKGSWSKQRLADEIARLRGMGFEVLPKLNFSAGHDQWLGEYARMLSTSTYYKVCSDLISETAELFDHPALFHLGMDEENVENQKHYNYMVVRQGDQWWYDFNKLIAATQSTGCRPWVWSDYAWQHEELFFKNMSRDVVQSNWYYWLYGDCGQSEADLACIRLYDKLDEAGFDQIPTGSNWSLPDNFSQMVAYGMGKLSPDRLLGFMQTPWHPTVREAASAHDGAIADLAKGIALYNR